MNTTPDGDNGARFYHRERTLNIEQAIHYAARQFKDAELCYGHGTDNPWDEAAWLVLHALGLSPVEPIEDAALELSDEQQAAVEAIVRERIETRKPAAYLTNQAWFCGLPFYVDERTLVPRSPIAELIEACFQPWLQHEPTRILDMCTGGGCIAIACAYAFPEAEVVGADLSPDALAVAARNVADHQLGDRMHLVESDMFSQVEGKFDLIVSNPPYVDLEDMSVLAEEFKREPQMGLASGNDGLDATRVILAKAKEHLTDDGVLVVEVGNSEAALAEAYPDLPFIWIEFERGGHGVFVLRAKDLP